MIKITAVKVILQVGGAFRGYAAITIDGTFVVRGIKIIEGKDGRLFIAMPSRKRSDGTYQDIAHPISRESRMVVEEAIRSEYDRMVLALTATSSNTTDIPSMYQNPEG